MMLALGLVGAVWAQEPSPSMAHVDANLALWVEDRGAVAAAVVQEAREQGGWFSQLTDDAVVVRVPSSVVDAFLLDTAALGEVVDRGYSRVDLSAELRDVQARLESRRSMLDQFLKVLGEASPKAVVQVEMEVTRVVTEIEQYEGRLKVLRDQAAFATVRVDLRFRDRRAPSRLGTSSFAWLNTLNVSDLLNDTVSGRRASRCGCTVQTPADFAPYEKVSRYQAVSPDDTVLRVRTVRHDPEAELDFWAEAVRRRMEEAGYQVLSQDTVTTAGGVAGTVLELGAAEGARDRVYLVGVFPDGRKLVIVEATAEAGVWKGRREAVRQALAGLEV